MKHKIDTGTALPVRQPLRRTPRGFESEEREYLHQQIEAGVLVPSKSPWASPVVLVRNADGSVRWCGDFRRVNDLTRKDAYPLPRIDSCLECLGSARLFSVFDLQSGYWQLPMDEGDQEKTAITTKYGLFEYTKLPFGLCSAPSTFQRCMEMVFRGVQWEILLIYWDDLIVFSDADYDEHFRRLQVVMQKLIQAGLKLKPSKCQLLQQEVLFLGHLVGKEGIKPNPALIEKVQDWPVPQNLRQLQAFLGLCNYYRRFVLKFSDIAAPWTGWLTRARLTCRMTEPSEPLSGSRKLWLLRPAWLCPWCARHTPAKLARLQREDPDLGPVMEWLDEGQPPSREEAASWSPLTRELWLGWDQLKRVDGVLYRCTPEVLPRVSTMQLLIPRVLRQEVLQFCHDSFFGGHLGPEKTVQRVQQRFHWAGLRRDVKHHIQSCSSCGRLQRAKGRGRASLQDYRVGYPMDRVAIDIKGPLPRTPRGNTVLLVVTDYFTRWVEAYPLANQQAETVAQHLVMEFIARLGCPLELHSDQGRNFESTLFAELNQLLGITRTRTSAYHPSGNGLVERFNHTLGQMMLSFIDLNKADWDLYIPLLTAAYRSTVHPATGFSPNFLMLGREVNLPVHVVFPTPRVRRTPPVSRNM